MKIGTLCWIENFQETQKTILNMDVDPFFTGSIISFSELSNQIKVKTEFGQISEIPMKYCL